MGKSVNGPDMQDCSTFLWELQQNHSCSVTVLLELDGSIGGYGWRGHILSVPRLLPGWSEAAGVGTSFRFPHRETKTFEGALFRALVDLDHLMAQAEFHRITGT